MTQLANEWVARDRSVTLVTWAGIESDHYVLDERVDRRALRASGPSRNLVEAIVGNLTRMRRLRRILQHKDRCVVVSFGESMNVLCVLAALGTRSRVLVCERNDPRHHRIGRLWSVARRLTYPWADLLVVQTDSVGRWARGIVRQDRVRVIPNPVRPVDCSLQAMPRAGRSRRRILAIGRLVEQKGFDVLLQAFERFSRDAPDWDLWLIGDGPLRADLEALVAGYRLADRVTFHGVVAGPERYMAESDLFVLSSRYEGFPNVLIEAMACGLPVISTDCPSGPRDIVRDGEDGILVPVDDVERLTQVISRLATDPARRAMLGREAKSVRERFSIEHVLRLWDEAISGVAR